MSNPNAQGQGNDKTVTIVVNGTKKTVQKGKLSYDQVVELAYPNPDYNANTYKVTYFHEHQKKESSLTKGQSVEVVDDMVFTVVPAVRS